MGWLIQITQITIMVDIPNMGVFCTNLMAQLYFVQKLMRVCLFLFNYHRTSHQLKFIDIEGIYDSRAFLLDPTPLRGNKPPKKPKTAG